MTTINGILLLLLYEFVTYLKEGDCLRFEIRNGLLSHQNIPRKRMDFIKLSYVYKPIGMTSDGMAEIFAEPSVEQFFALLNLGMSATIKCLPMKSMSRFFCNS